MSQEFASLVLVIVVIVYLIVFFIDLFFKLKPPSLKKLAKPEELKG